MGGALGVMFAQASGDDPVSLGDNVLAEETDRVNT